MSNNEDWLMRPVLARLCSFESLKNGTLSLFDLVRLNEALDVQEENTYRVSKIPPQGK